MKIVDGLGFFNLYVRVMSELHPVEIVLLAEYVEEGCYHLPFTLEQPDQYWLQAIVRRKDDNSFLQSQPVLIEVVGESGR